jgi:hypothetical protein
MDKLALVIPIWKRHPLTNYLLTWYHLMSVPEVELTLIVVGSEGEMTRRLARGLEYLEASNDLIDRKYDMGIAHARRFNPEAVCLVGSDDFITAPYFEWAFQQVRAGVDLVGLLDFYLADLPGRRILYWGGYTGKRRGGLIGAGRVYSRRILEAIGWKPYWSPAGYCHTLRDDERSFDRIVQAGGCIRAVNMAHLGCQYWAVKTGQEWNPVEAFEKQYPLIDITPHAWKLFERTVRHDVTLEPA